MIFLCDCLLCSSSKFETQLVPLPKDSCPQFPGILIEFTEMADTNAVFLKIEELPLEF